MHLSSKLGSHLRIYLFINISSSADVIHYSSVVRIRTVGAERLGLAIAFRILEAPGDTPGCSDARTFAFEISRFLNFGAPWGGASGSVGPGVRTSATGRPARLPCGMCHTPYTAHPICCGQVTRSLRGAVLSQARGLLLVGRLVGCWGCGPNSPLP
eukprot:scaffold21361_cov140-Isochrysis_galbana.AAC.1